tara:strand:- start:714 stop:1022 length:309 start_codon:yes stop_codon:yes gene_type:complete
MEKEFKLKLNEGKIELSDEVRKEAGLEEGDNVILKVDDDGMISMQKREPWVVAEDGYVLYTDGTDNSEEMLAREKSNQTVSNRDDSWIEENFTSKRELGKAI